MYPASPFLPSRPRQRRGPRPDPGRGVRRAAVMARLRARQEQEQPYQRSLPLVFRLIMPLPTPREEKRAKSSHLTLAVRSPVFHDVHRVVPDDHDRVERARVHHGDRCLLGF